MNHGIVILKRDICEQNGNVLIPKGTKGILTADLNPLEGDGKELGMDLFSVWFEGFVPPMYNFEPYSCFGEWFDRESKVE